MVTLGGEHKRVVNTINTFHITVYKIMGIQVLKEIKTKYMYNTLGYAPYYP